MKSFFLALLLAVTTVAPAMAAEAWLKPVKAENICMMNDKAFDKPQRAVEVEGKTYYGCCPMCAEKLQKEAAMRTAKDPVSGKEVDKASAVIGADSEGKAYYFENEKNFKKFASGPAPSKTEHKH